VSRDPIEKKQWSFVALAPIESSGSILLVVANTAVDSRATAVDRSTPVAGRTRRLSATAIFRDPFRFPPIHDGRIRRFPTDRQPQDERDREGDEEQDHDGDSHFSVDTRESEHKRFVS